MLEALNFLLEKANALLAVCLKYPAGEGTDGISAGDIQTLQTAIDDAKEKNTAQEKAVETEIKLTDLQAQTMEKGHGLIRKTQNAGQSEYGKENKPRNKEFHIGGETIKSVKTMGAELKYMKSVATDNKADLAKHGFKDSDITNFDAISTELDTNSSNQKDAQKVQKAATKERDDSMKNLQKAARRVQKAAKVVFEKQPSVLIEFESIHDGRHAAKTPTPAVDKKAAAQQPSQSK
jgi:hypothetical protein